MGSKTIYNMVSLYLAIFLLTYFRKLANGAKFMKSVLWSRSNNRLCFSNKNQRHDFPQALGHDGYEPNYSIYGKLLFAVS